MEAAPLLLCFGVCYGIGFGIGMGAGIVWPLALCYGCVNIVLVLALRCRCVGMGIVLAMLLCWHCVSMHRVGAALLLCRLYATPSRDAQLSRTFPF